MTTLFDLSARPFRGVYPILYCYFGSDGRIDHGAIKAQIEACLALKPDGLAVLGLATEIMKLTEVEKHQLVDLTLATVAGRVPVAVTIGGPNPADRMALISRAREQGASWLILQPAPEALASEPALVDAFSSMMAHADMPVAIQHAPQFLGATLSMASFNLLRSRHTGFTLLKGEGSALETAQLAADTDDAFAIFAGRAGVEWPDMIRAGAAGLIPAPELLDVMLAIDRRMRSGDEAGAEALYRDALPVVSFIMQSLASLHTYGKRLLAERIGLGAVHDRAPFTSPTALGLRILKQRSAFLGRWGG
ncbi:MAG: dihydrodipicolinate synthase family protein [Hyphomicrobiales bacterium]|jgi:2-keto-3-deoxy-L-arabinonate dehydratase|nr:dihydrodipicolinate synthase family protein [Hyphomicrobiales bacterium]